MAFGRRTDLASPRFLRKRRHLFIRKTLVAIVSIALIITSFIFICRLEILRIQDIRIEGNAVIAGREIGETAERAISGFYLQVIPKDSIFFYPKKFIYDSLVVSLKRIDTLSISLEGQWQGLSVMVITLTERKPAYVWCQDENTAVCYAADRSGYVFDEAPSFSGDAFLRLYGGDSQGPGTSYLSEELFTRAMEFVSGISRLFPQSPTLKPVALNVLDPGTEVDREAELILKGGGKIKFFLGTDVLRLVESARATLSSNKLASSSIEYLDLRFNNKAYYKVR